MMQPLPNRKKHHCYSTSVCVCVCVSSHQQRDCFLQLCLWIPLKGDAFDGKQLFALGITHKKWNQPLLEAILLPERSTSSRSNARFPLTDCVEKWACSNTVAFTCRLVYLGFSNENLFDWLIVEAPSLPRVILEVVPSLRLKRGFPEHIYLLLDNSRWSQSFLWLSLRL
jgi:hypothetical protein